MNAGGGPGLFRKGIVGVVMQVGAGVALYLLALTVSRLVGPDGTGGVFWTLTLISLVSLVCRLGFDTSIVYFVPRRRDAGGAAANLGLVVTSLASTVTLTSLFAVAFQVWGRPPVGAAAEAARVMMWALPLQAFVQQVGSVGQAHGRIAWTFLQRAAVPTVAWVVTVGAWALRGALDVTDIATLYLAGVTAVAAVAAVLLVRLMRRTYPGVRPDGAATVLRATLRYSLGIWPNNVVNYAFGNADTLLLGLLSTAAETGIYSSAAKTALFVAYVLLGAGAAYAPHVSRTFRDDEPAALATDYHRVSRWVLLATLPIGAVLVLDGRWVLDRFGDGFAAAYAPLVILVAAQVVNAATGPVGFLLSMTGRQRYVTVHNAVVFAVALALFVVAIPRWGAMGAAIVTAFAVAAKNVGLVAWARRALGVRPWWGALGFLAASALIALAAGIVLPDTAGVRSLGFVVTYGLLALRFGLTPHERRRLLAVRLRRPHPGRA